MSRKEKGKGSRIGQGEPQSEMQIISWATIGELQGQGVL